MNKKKVNNFKSLHDDCSLDQRKNSVSRQILGCQAGKLLEHRFDRFAGDAFGSFQGHAVNIMNRKFANHRGLIRTGLADLMWRLGPYRKYGEVDWGKVKRLVFICQGNICRSPFGLYLARAADTDLPVVSFGLATTTGAPANSVAMDVAAEFGMDLSEHRATDLTDFDILADDLLIVMEDRHIKWLAPHLTRESVQICLLGLWCRPRFALLYDPYGQSRAYFSSCFSRIERAVANLLQERKDYSSI